MTENYQEVVQTAEPINLPKGPIPLGKYIKCECGYAAELIKGKFCCEHCGKKIKNMDIVTQ